MKKIKIGPGLIIAAAFIGPGTVTTCTLAGASSGYMLLWALVFAIFATYVLQEMSGRLGLVSGAGLGEALGKELPDGFARIGAIFLVVSAIGIGNAAYQTGNILGAALGLSAVSGLAVTTWAPVIGLVAFGILFTGSYKVLERILGGLVFIMSLCFVVTAVMLKPDLSAIFSGMFLPSIKDSTVPVVLGLIGTTIVPYNLFLYASVVKNSGAEDLGSVRNGLLAAVVLGGLISMAIVVTSSAAFYGSGREISNVSDMAMQLEPLLGSWAKNAIAIGLFGAGITSSITAPLAASYAVAGVMKWDADPKSFKFRAVWMSVLFTGILFASIGLKPLPAILFAQAANGLILPIVAIFLLIVMNNKRLLKEYVNGAAANIIGGIIILVALALGLKNLIRLFL